MNTNQIQIKFLNTKEVKSNDSFLPEYATSGSSALDLKACISKKIILPAKEVVLVPTGISILSLIHIYSIRNDIKNIERE